MGVSLILVVALVVAMVPPVQVEASNPYSKGQCTWWAYQRWTQLLGYEPKAISGNAGGWYDNCVSKGYTRGSEPKVGAIVCCNNGFGNDTGHVAIVEAVYSDHISISEYNWNTPLGYGTANVYFSNINRSSSSKPNRHLKGYIYLPGTSDTTAPVISDQKIESVDSDGYMISAKVSDNVGVTAASCATWTDSNGQDDIIWRDMVVNNGVAKIYVPFSEHGNEAGHYNNHIYVWDASGNNHAVPIDYTRDTTAPILSDPKIEGVDAEGYMVSVKVSDNVGIFLASCATWTATDGQNDIIWREMVVDNGVARIYVPFSDHGNEVDYYNNHIYVWDAERNSSFAEADYTRCEDIGTDFYAKIVNIKLGSVIANQDGYATSRINTDKADRLWKFKKQEDNSYKIISCLDGTVLDVDHAKTSSKTDILCHESNDSSNQRWYISKNGSGYTLMPAHAQGMALDVWGLYSEDGSKTMLYPWADKDDAEIFRFDKVTDLSSYYAKMDAIKVYNDKDHTKECTQFNEGETAYLGLSGTNIDEYKVAVYRNNKLMLEQTAEKDAYSISNLEKGTYEVKVTPINELSSTKGTATTKFTVKKSMESCTVSLNTSSYTYDGNKKTPTVTAKDGDVTLIKETDYTVSYTNNVNAGTATVTITGKGNYSGQVAKTFTIKKADQDLQTIISDTNIIIGESATITAKGFGTITYTSKDDAIATVSALGEVTGKGEGSTIITIKASGNSNYNAAQKTIDITVDNTNVITPGDVNGDGNVNMKDYSLLQQYLNNWDVTIIEPAADVNADKKINMKDYSLLQQYLNGWEVELK